MKENIFKIILAIRECMKKEFSNFPLSCCYETSLVAENVFNKLEYTAKTIEGEFEGVEHYWNIINGILCDLTSDQFDKPYGIIKDVSSYKANDEYSLQEQMELCDEEDDDSYEELEEINDLINRISNKCIRLIRSYNCV